MYGVIYVNSGVPTHIAFYHIYVKGFLPFANNLKLSGFSYFIDFFCPGLRFPFTICLYSIGCWCYGASCKEVNGGWVGSNARCCGPPASRKVSFNEEKNIWYAWWRHSKGNCCRRGTGCPHDQWGRRCIVVEQWVRSPMVLYFRHRSSLFSTLESMPMLVS